jgi:hypothetical protein
MSISKVITAPGGSKKRTGNYAHIKVNRLKNKQRLVALFGGERSACGYKTCISALHFHHRDPQQRSLGIPTKGHGQNFEALLEEAKKRVLVCSNCHHEIREGIVVV